MANGKDDMVKKVALGVTGLAIATGAVAAGVALTNRRNRTALKRGAQKTMGNIRKVQKVLEEGHDRYQAYQHRIGVGKGMMKKAAQGIRKKSKKMR